jgi:hypothetical protein
MEELLKKLLESELLNEETVKAIRGRISEVEAKAEARAKKKLEEQYNTDRQRLVAAADLMISEGVEKAIREFAEERLSLKKLAARAAKAISESDKRSNEKASKRLAALEIMLEGALESELREFRNDRKAERAAVVKAIRETRASAERERETFVKRGAVVLETVVDEMLGKKMKELESDIRAARRNDMGRRMMEAFAAEFRSSFYSENAEAKKLAKALVATKRKLEETRRLASKKIQMSENRASEAAREAKLLKEQATRSAVMGELLSKVSGETRKQMKVILESQQTHKLRDAFKKFLPEVTKTNGRLLESKRPTPRLELKEGNREQRDVTPATSDLDDLARLRNAAGIRG